MPKLFLTFDEHCQLGDTLRNVQSLVSELVSSAGRSHKTIEANIEKLRTILDRTMREDFAYLGERQKVGGYRSA